MLKNKAGQKWKVFAFNRNTNIPVLGDAANITAQLSKDWGTAAATNDVNPTESPSGGGYYLFDMQQAETDANGLDLFPVSATADVQVVDARSFSILEPAKADAAVYWIWIDEILGTVAADGSPGNAFANLSLAIAYANDNSLAPRFKFSPGSSESTYSIGMDSTNIPQGAIIDFNGSNTSALTNPISINPQTVFKSTSTPSQMFFATGRSFGSGITFENLFFTSFALQTLILDYPYFLNCVFESIRIQGTSAVGDPIVFYQCSFESNGAETPIDLSSDANTQVVIHDSYGDIVLENVVTGAEVSHYGWGRMRIDSTCTGGKITVTSHVEIFENDGITSWDYTNTTNRPTVELVSNSLSTIDSQTASNLPYYQLLARSDAALEADRAAELAILNTDEGTGPGDYASTSDSQEAIRAVAGGGGGGGGGYTPFG